MDVYCYATNIKIAIYLKIDFFYLKIKKNMGQFIKKTYLYFILQEIKRLGSIKTVSGKVKLDKPIVLYSQRMPNAFEISVIYFYTTLDGETHLKDPDIPHFCENEENMKIIKNTIESIDLNNSDIEYDEFDKYFQIYKLGLLASIEKSYHILKNAKFSYIQSSEDLIFLKKVNHEISSIMWSYSREKAPASNDTKDMCANLILLAKMEEESNK